MCDCVTSIVLKKKQTAGRERGGWEGQDAQTLRRAGKGPLMSDMVRRTTNPTLVPYGWKPSVSSWQEEHSGHARTGSKTEQPRGELFESSFSGKAILRLPFWKVITLKFQTLDQRPVCLLLFQKKVLTLTESRNGRVLLTSQIMTL